MGMESTSRIYVAGHRGLVGSAIMRALQARGYAALLTRTHAELELSDQRAEHAFLAQEPPQKPAQVWMDADDDSGRTGARDG